MELRQVGDRIAVCEYDESACVVQDVLAILADGANGLFAFTREFMAGT